MITIFKSALIITMDPERKIWNNASLVIQDDRIIAIGRDEEIEAKYHPDVIKDCKGKVLLPGFINLHTHQTLSIIRGVAEDMGTAPAYTKSVPQGYQLLPQESETMALLGAAEAVKFGSTYICDMYTNCEASAMAFRKIGIRASVCEMVHDMDFSTLYKRVYQVDETLGEEILQRNIQFIERWEKDSLITPCISVHAPDTCSASFIRKIMKLKEKYGVKLAVHLAQSKGEIEQVQKVTGGKSPVEFFYEMGVLGSDTLAAHCIYVNDTDVNILSRTHTNIVHIPEGNAKGGMVAPLEQFRSKNINITLGTDNGSADMIDAMRIGLCINRVRTNSFSIMPLNMLEMATINAAKAIGRQNELGSLEEGKLADLLVVDFHAPHLIPCLNPVGTLIHTGLGSDIEQVYVNGKQVVDQGKLINIDEQEVLKEAQLVAEKKWLNVNKGINPYFFIHL